MDIIKLTEDTLMVIRETQNIKDEPSKVEECWECGALAKFYLCDDCDNKLDNSAHRDGELT